MTAIALALLLAAWEELLETGNRQFREGRYAEAERSYLAASQRAGTSAASPELAASLNNLASAYQELGRTRQAERLYLRSIEVWSKAPGAAADGTAKPLNNLGTLYRTLRRFADAERCYLQSAELRLKTVGPEDPVMAPVWNNLAKLYQAQGDFVQAQKLYDRVLAIWTAPGLERGGVLSNLGSLQRAMGQITEARRTLKESLRLYEEAVGADHPSLIDVLVNSAKTEIDEKNVEAAAGFLSRACAIAEQRLGPEHTVTARLWVEYGGILRKLKRRREAERYESKAAEVLRRSPEAQTVAVSDLGPLTVH